MYFTIILFDALKLIINIFSADFAFWFKEKFIALFQLFLSLSF